MVIYSVCDKRCTQVVSKGDTVQVLVDSKWKKGIALQMNLVNIRIQLEGSDQILDRNRDVVQIVEKLIKPNHSIPIEVNDFVTLLHDNEIVTAIVTQVQSFIQVTITSQKYAGKVIIVPAAGLRFVAKGYSIYDFQPILAAKNGRAGTGTDLRSPPRPAGVSSPQYVASMKSSFTPLNQMNCGMALLYPAPCIIMAIPPSNDPADFPECMAVQLPWRELEEPTILPVIRMGPGTMVVVVPASSSAGV